ncbi:MAG: UDP-N-acetylglucosamine 1-carboxyvinyltransferase [Candidatus Levybacteria bacterium]|nr:UDP-N-acetylglucosamine 1-carboxyvinyltransferase [Candidatus Levybacteria bacterium]MBI4098264.1 UDP-N-acetylglucosamine 1-carboxyvinyltransferase [Candidatus Levybacteria bacterium]
MKKFTINGGRRLSGKTEVSGAKNVALKTLVAACLTNEEVIIENVPLISDFFVMCDIIKELGGEAEILDHKVRIRMRDFAKTKIGLDRAAEIRTSTIFLAPLLSRKGEAIIPNPGGCRLGARPIDRIIDGLIQMGAKIKYLSEDGYFHAKAETLSGIDYRFEKNTHMGTETLILAAVMAKGKTVLENAAEEPEIDELIGFLNSMGAKIRRSGKRIIEIEGVDKLHGTHWTILPDRNEIVTIAIAAIITGGDVFIKEVKKEGLVEFLEKLDEAGAGYEIKDDGIRFFAKGPLKATSVTTSPYPGFMTDWQAPWAILMTQVQGESIIHETVFENKLEYIKDLQKMGVNAKLFNPEVKDKDEIYNFNLKDDHPEYFHAVKITGPTPLHNAVLTMHNIRAGAAVVLAALLAKGESTILEIEHLDRGYEKLEERLNNLGASIKRAEE